MMIQCKCKCYGKDEELECKKIRVLIGSIFNW